MLIRCAPCEPNDQDHELVGEAEIQARGESERPLNLLSGGFPPTTKGYLQPDCQFCQLLRRYRTPRLRGSPNLGLGTHQAMRTDKTEWRHCRGASVPYLIAFPRQRLLNLPSSTYLPPLGANHGSKETEHSHHLGR
jgi:hypothetical protein